MAESQPNSIFRRFPTVSDFSGLPGTPIVGPVFHTEIGWRNFPNIHQLSFEWGGTVAPTGCSGKLQGTNYHDPERATEAQWFDITPTFNFTPAGLTAKINSEVSPARGVRYVIETITGGTDPTLTPVYAGQC